MNIILEAINSKESKNPKSLPSLQVPSYFLISVENTKKIINIFGTNNFGFSTMYIYDYDTTIINNLSKRTSYKVRVKVNQKGKIM